MELNSLRNGVTSGNSQGDSIFNAFPLPFTSLLSLPHMQSRRSAKFRIIDVMSRVAGGIVPETSSIFRISGQVEALVGGTDERSTIVASGVRDCLAMGSVV